MNGSRRASERPRAVVTRRPDQRPRPTTRLEAEIRDYWDASVVLARLDVSGSDPRMSLPTAVEVLSTLATAHSLSRLRRRAADRLMSFAPEAAAELLNRQSATKTRP